MNQQETTLASSVPSRFVPFLAALTLLLGELSDGPEGGLRTPEALGGGDEIQLSFQELHLRPTYIMIHILHIIEYAVYCYILSYMLLGDLGTSKKQKCRVGKATMRTPRMSAPAQKWYVPSPIVQNDQ